ncbi:hypothetical protein ACKKBG_A34260 [Auxenochlorella protothecoides x Auxenochlorella symbiontica]
MEVRRPFLERQDGVACANRSTLRAAPRTEPWCARKGRGHLLLLHTPPKHPTSLINTIARPDPDRLQLRE